MIIFLRCYARPRCPGDMLPCVTRRNSALRQLGSKDTLSDCEVDVGDIRTLDDGSAVINVKGKGGLRNRPATHLLGRRRSDRRGLTRSQVLEMTAGLPRYLAALARRPERSRGFH